MIRGIRRTLNVGPWSVALYGSLFGAVAGAVFALALISEYWGTEAFTRFLPASLFFGIIGGSIVGLVSVAVGLGLRAILSTGDRLNSTTVALGSSTFLLATAVLSTWFMRESLGTTFPTWLPITLAVVGVVWFGFWSRMRSARSAKLGLRS
ncbi:hypothetical protein V6245_10710 [Salinibacterium amurskyense]|uniref:hypothetical protein n=1 Tax=Salinibacterium amurskyense TaxID=205941 RepID=UPI00311D4DC2